MSPSFSASLFFVSLFGVFFVIIHPVRGGSLANAFPALPPMHVEQTA